MNEIERKRGKRREESKRKGERENKARENVQIKKKKYKDKIYTLAVFDIRSCHFYEYLLLNYTLFLVYFF